MENGNCLDRVLTAGEAAKRWGLHISTVSTACREGRFRPGEVRRTGRDWLVLTSAMVRVYGRPKR